MLTGVGVSALGFCYKCAHTHIDEVGVSADIRKKHNTHMPHYVLIDTHMDKNWDTILVILGPR